MCGIAGLIHRGKTSNVGEELQHMLQALKHRGPDSTGYALYANNDGQNFILRFKVGENVGEGSTSVNEDESVYDERKKLVDKKLSELTKTSEEIVRRKRSALKIVPVYKKVDTCAAEFKSFTPYMYSTYQRNFSINSECESDPSNKKKNNYSWGRTK